VNRQPLARSPRQPRCTNGDGTPKRWMASNVAVETDAAGNLKCSKKKSSERIDGIVAGVMALGRALLRQEPTSVYATRGLLTV
jgi:phage terminase large subunit-like protein